MESHCQGETLAEKYRSFNKAVYKAASNQLYDLKDINYDEPDIDNLFKIEVASQRKNVNFILDVFKSKDILYASRAIKLGTWLISNNEYDHIINPDYIHKHLAPHMTLKAFNMLMIKIRHTLRDVKRVDEFFNYFKEKDLNRAFKWLPNCSPDLAEKTVRKFYDRITLSTMEKFGNNSNSVYIYCKYNKDNYDLILKALNILKKNNTEKYINCLFDLVDGWYSLDKLSAGKTKKIIKQCPDKTLNDFLCFLSIIHIPTLAKYFSGQEIKEVLIKNSRHKKYESLYKYDKLKYFLARLPQEDKHDLIKNVFIAKVKPVYTNETDLRNSTMIRCLTNMNNAYLWCEYLSFDDAFRELKRFIEVESNPAKKSYMLCTLLSSAHKNFDHIKIVLEYYVNSHLHEGFRFKTQFLQHILREVNILKLNADSWNILNILFYNVGVYTKVENSFPKYKPNPFIVIGRRRKRYGEMKLESDDIFVDNIILYNIIHDIDIPDILHRKFKHSTFKEFDYKINNRDKHKVFQFLFENLNCKLEKYDTEDVNNFDGILLTIINVCELLKDWDKSIFDYPEMLTRIRKIRVLFLDAKYDCSELDCFLKSMKFKLEMEESDVITAELCMRIIETNPKRLLELVNNKDIKWNFSRKPMRRFLSKLRCFYQDIAIEFKRITLKTESNSDICWGLLTKQDVLALIQQHFSTKVWNREANEIGFAKKLHLFRPCVSLETALDLCNDNKIQYFILSIHSLMYNMDPFSVSSTFLKLQNLCSSRKKPLLQKHCLDVALRRLKHQERMTVLKNIWIKSDNEVSRFLVFQKAFALLKENNDEETMWHYWSLLSGFIDGIIENESSKYVKILINSYDIPNAIKMEYCEKVQCYLNTLSEKTALQEFVKKFDLDPEEKNKNLNEIFKRKSFYPPYWLQEYILETSSEKLQMERYEKLIIPLLNDDKFIMSERAPFIAILRSFYRDLDSKLLNRRAVIPLAMFTDIQRRLEEKLPFYENYVFLTAGRLFLGYLRLLKVNINKLIFSDEITKQTQEDFGVFCGDYLSDEMEKHFSDIYMSFSDVLTYFFHATENQANMRFIDAMLKRNPRTECFLTIINILPRKTYRTPDDVLFCSILEKIRNHPSEEVRMLYSNYFIKTDSL